MMKRMFVCMSIVALSTIFVSFSEEQEFIKQPKVKRFYPSCQQYTELNAAIVDVSNQLQGAVVRIQSSAIADINDYVDGEKDCFIHKATKKHRADQYAKKMNVKRKLEDAVRELLLLHAEIEAGNSF